MTKWGCPDCDLKVQVVAPTGAEGAELLRVIRDIHAPHCPGERAEAGEP